MDFSWRTVAAVGDRNLEIEKQQISQHGDSRFNVEKKGAADAAAAVSFTTF